MNFRKFKGFTTAWMLGMFERLKAERVQDRTVAEETPMTVERACNRAVDIGWELVWTPVAVQRRFDHDDFNAAIDFVAGDVRYVAEQLGITPKIKIDEGDVIVTLGIPIPPLLSEGDFDAAEALEAMTSPGTGGTVPGAPQVHPAIGPEAGA